MHASSFLFIYIWLLNTKNWFELLYTFFLTRISYVFIHSFDAFFWKSIKTCRVFIHIDVKFWNNGSVTDETCSPRIPALTKWTRLKYSSRSFWMGVPDMSTLLWADILFKLWYVWLSEFFRRWPCSRSSELIFSISPRHENNEGNKIIKTVKLLFYLIAKMF